MIHKIIFATIVWLIFAAAVIVSPSLAAAAGIINMCILGGTFAVLSEAETEQEKIIFSWVGIASSSILLLILVYWGLIQ